MTTVVKMFGKGQITLPKRFRDANKTNHFVLEDTAQGLLIKPIISEVYYEIDEQNFGLNFPSGISAKDLLNNLQENR